MERGQIVGVPTPASRLVLGVAHPEAHRFGPALWETFVERGGNCFDTAHHYGEENERALGAWLETRGIRDEVVLIGKAGHSPTTAPEFVGPQLDESLERLRTDRLDLFLLHRDDPAVPIGEWVEALHEQVRSGRVHAVGVSNWTVERAAAFAKTAKLAAVSSQLSLAELAEPVWAGCLAVDADTGAWLERTGIPLVAWSAQGRGFFGGRSGLDEEMQRCWLTPENVERRRRAEELAGRLGVPATTVALAWVLHRPFLTFAAVGPRSPEELEACLAATELTWQSAWNRLR